MTYRFFTSLALASVGIPALAANALGPSTVNITPTFNTAGIRLFTTGDDNASAAATLQYRVTGQTTWKPAQPLIRIGANRLAGLLFNLSEGVSYDVQVTPTDTDGTVAPIVTTFKTRVTPVSVTTGKTINVTATGSTTPDGTTAHPYGTITAGLHAATAGDTVLIQPGVYREEIVDTDRSGTPAAPITIKAAGAGVKLTGALASLELPHTKALWTKQTNGSYFTPLANGTLYVAANGIRLFHYTTSSAFSTAVSSASAGWFQDPSTKTLYVYLAGGASPDAIPIQVAQLQMGLQFVNQHDVIVDGLDIGFYGIDFSEGLYINNSSNITVRNCKLHNADYPLFVKDASTNNLIEKNEVYDTGMSAWSWASIKGTDQEGVGIYLTSGHANVVRLNTIHDIFNGVSTAETNGDAAGDMDVYYNNIQNVGDDGLEPEGACVNDRLWCNTVHSCQNGVSIAPIDVGPLWVLYNNVSQYREGSLKIADGSPGPVRAYQNTFVTTLSPLNALSPATAMNPVVLRNNIFYGTRYVIEDYYTTAPNIFDYDLLYTTDTTKFVKWDDNRYTTLSALQSGTGQELHGITGDPKFTDVQNGVFLLQGTSPARHKALVLADINDFFPFAPDLGCYQMGN